MPARELSPTDLRPNEVEILRIGEHHGAEIDLTSADLDDIVTTYDPSNAHEATAVIDHDWEYDREPTDRRRSGINHAIVDRVRRVKDSVVAHLTNVSAELKTLVNERRLNALSPELYPRYRGTGKKYLRCVAFQGAEPPAQKGMLKPVLFSESDGEQFLAAPIANPTARFAEARSKGRNAMTDEEKAAKKKADDAAKKIADDAAEQARKDAATAAAAEAKRLADEAAERARKEAEQREPALASMRAMLTEALDAAVKPLRETIGRLETRLADIDPASGEQAILAFAEKLVAKGIIAGKDKDREVARMKALRGQTIKFGEESVSALQDYMDAALERAPVMPVGELPAAGPGVLHFAEGEKKPEFEVLVPEGATDADKKRYKAVAKYAVEKGIKTFGAATVAFERAEKAGEVAV